MNKEEEQAIERLKEIAMNTYAEGKARAIDTVLNLIEKLQKENKLAKQALIKNCNIADERNQLLKENEELKDKYATFVKMSSEVIANSVPIQKVKYKIEELNKKEQELQNNISTEEREDYSDANISWELMDINIRREVLQELLEKEE